MMRSERNSTRAASHTIPCDSLVKGGVHRPSDNDDDDDCGDHQPLGELTVSQVPFQLLYKYYSFDSNNIIVHILQTRKLRHGGSELTCHTAGKQ